MIDIKIANVSGLQNFSTKINNKGLYIIEGENTSGKTSFIASFLSLIKSDNFLHKIKPKSGFPELEIKYKNTTYGYPNKSTKFLSKNVNAQTLSFCDSENKIISIIMENEKTSQDKFNFEIINLLGYQSYQKILNVSKNMLENYEEKIDEISGKLLTINYSQIISFIKDTKKEIKEIEENISELYSYILEITKKKVRLSNVEKIIADLEQKISNLQSGKKINFGASVFSKNIGLDKIKEKIKVLYKSIEESEEPHNTLKDNLILKNQKRDKHSINLFNIKLQIDDIDVKINKLMIIKDELDIINLERKIKTFKSKHKCSECESNITNETVSYFQDNLIKIKVSLVGKERSIANKEKEKKKIEKRYSTALLEMDVFTKEIDKISEKIQDYESFIKQSTKEISQLQKVLLEGEAIEEYLRNDLVENEKLRDIFQLDIEKFDKSLVIEYDDLKESFEQQKSYLKELENKKKEYNNLQASKTHLTASKNKLLYLYNYIDKLLNTTLKTFEQQITKSLDLISKKLDWNFNEIKFENGKLFIKRKNRVMDLSKLSTAERSSLAIILLYNMKKFLLPEFPFFFIDDIGGFDHRRQEKIIRFISDDINSLDTDSFCFITKTRKDTDLNIYKYNRKI